MNSVIFLYAAIAIDVGLCVKWFLGDKRDAERERREEEMRRAAAAKIEVEDEEEDDDDWHVRVSSNKLRAFRRQYEVVGESFDNEDGTSRQDILRDYANFSSGYSDPLTSIEEFEYEGERALAVKINDQQIGCIARKDLPSVFRDLKTAENIYLSVVGGGDEDLYGAKVTLICNG